MSNYKLSRRRVLRGLLQGSAVGVGLPLLDMFLDDNGAALANGDSLPTCFGTWYWGLGLCPHQWEPEQVGANFQLRPILKALEPVKDKINIYSGTQVMLNGNKTVGHHSGQQCLMTGKVSDKVGELERTIDQVVADKLPGQTRFTSLTVSCDGNPNRSYSSRGLNATNPAEISPVALYQRIFVNGFQDPNSNNFTPDPEVILRKSALSYVADERQVLMKKAGANDRNRLDEFFGSLRSLEQKLALELEKPAPMPSCSVPQGPDGERLGLDIDVALNTHNLFADLLCHALACGQTRVFNMTLSQDIVKSGDPISAHTYTHDQPDDPKLGYKPMAYWFASRYMEGLASIVSRLDGIREGDGTLLDRTLLLAYSEHGDAAIHDFVRMPYFTAGTANGRIKTGWHVADEGGPCTRVALTCLQALGMPAESWGVGSNQASEPFTDVLV